MKYLEGWKEKNGHLFSYICTLSSLRLEAKIMNYREIVTLDYEISPQIIDYLFLDHHSLFSN